MLSDAIGPIVDFVLPPRCALCGDRIAMNSGLCAGCWPRLDIPTDPCCALCQRPFRSAAMDEGSVCAPCLAKAPKHDGIIAATLYNDASRQIVLSLKHGKRIGHARTMGAMIAARMQALEGEWLLVPVPLHRRRMWRRSFNQAALITDVIGGRTGLPVAVDALLRIRNSSALGGLGRKARRSEVHGAIVANPKRAIDLQGRNIILVDDVVTSGATSSECLRALKRAGARKIKIACFARVLEEALAVP